MKLIQSLSTFALRQAAECASFGAKSEAEALVRSLVDHLSDQSQRLPRALRAATENAWKALEIALAGESFWQRCKVLLARAENRALGQQIRAFLDAVSIDEPQNGGPAFRQCCLDELQAARKAEFLTGGRLAPLQLAEDAVRLAKLQDPQQRIDAEWAMIDDMANRLREHRFTSLAQLIAMRPAQGPSILALAVTYFFRRQIEDSPQLFQGLAFTRLEKLASKQEEGFAALSEVLDHQAQRLEELLGDVRLVVVETHDAVLDLQEQIQGQSEQLQQVGRAVVDLLQQHQLHKRELRPSDSLSIRNDGERQLVRQLVAHYRALPEGEQRKLPALLNALGKLEVVAGDFEGARRDFQKVASLSTDVALQAEAHFHAYQAALQQRDWQTALAELLEATKLDAARFAPFPFDKLTPQRILGAGGFGVVFLCRHAYMEGDVVVKALATADLAQNVEQVFAEATALRRLDHGSIIRIQDCGYADTTNRARPYLVMDYFDGMTLEEAVREVPLTVHEFVQAACQMAEGLQAAHQRGILHRDVKPANVLARLSGAEDGPQWQVKLIDFGLALHRTALQSTQVSSKTLMGQTITGTLEYAAPEQLGRLEGVTVGPQADVYGFAKTCCHILFQTPEPTLRHWQSVPVALADLLGECLEKRPEKRPANFAAVLNRLNVVRKALATQRAPSDQESLPVAPTRATKQQLREAAERAEQQRQQMERQERRLLDAAAEAERQRVLLERASVPVVLPASRRSRAPAKKASQAAPMGCLFIAVLIVATGVVMVLHATGVIILGRMPTLKLASGTSSPIEVKPWSQTYLNVTIDRGDFLGISPVKLDIEAPKGMTVRELERTGTTGVRLHINCTGVAGVYTVKVTPKVGERRGQTLEFEVQILGEGQEPTKPLSDPTKGEVKKVDDKKVEDKKAEDKKIEDKKVEDKKVPDKKEFDKKAAVPGCIQHEAWAVQIAAVLPALPHSAKINALDTR